MKRFLDIFLSLVLFVALAACGGTTATPPSTTLLNLKDIPTKTLIPGPLSIKSTPMPAVTLRPTMTLVATPTADNMLKLAGEFNIPVVCLANAYLLSRDQEWLSVDCRQLHEFVIAGRTSGAPFIISYTEIYDEDPNTFSVIPLNWSANDQYLYFTTRCCTLDDRANSNGSLYEYDSNNKTWKKLIKGDIAPLYFFSTDGLYIATFNGHVENDIYYHRNLEIVTIEIESHTVQRYILDRYETKEYEVDQEYAWSKDNNKFGLIIGRPNYRESITIDVLVILDFSKNTIELREEFDNIQKKVDGR